jgi:CysZ protein
MGDREAKKGNALDRFFRGMGFFGRGLGFTARHPSLWGWVLAPTLLTLAVVGAGIASFWGWGKHFVDAHTVGHGAFLAGLLTVLLVIVAAGVGYVAYLAISVVATAPFSGYVSERTEKLATGQVVTPRGIAATVTEALRSVGHTLLGLTIYLSLSAVLFVVHWAVPVTAPFVWVLSVILTSLFLAYDAWDQPLSRRGAGFGQKWGRVKAHLAESLGFGSMVALCLAVPLLGLLVVPVAAVGGELLFLDLEGSRR